MEEEFRALLIAAGLPGVTAQTINWAAHPQGLPWPGVILHLIDGREAATMDGPDGLFRGRVQVDCYALSFGAAKAVARGVVAAFDGYRGGGFQGVFRVASRDGREGGTNEVDRPFRCSLDFMVNWRTP